AKNLCNYLYAILIRKSYYIHYSFSFFIIVIAILEANYSKDYMFEATYKIQQCVTYDEED
ncbi:hypothetical protein OQJ66_18605, partial [Aquimarina muelleri]|uniref:hypothetical protein n=1 Tax=Aquimarina muelleri TaxID=279356 RepID=UPI0022496783